MKVKLILIILAIALFAFVFSCVRRLSQLRTQIEYLDDGATVGL
jgi:hypothetical protein